MSERASTKGREPGDYHGHMTMADGSHVALTADEAKALWEASEAAQAKSEADFPDEQTALREMSRAHHRLKDFGWRDAIYCPKDGSEFEVIEAGSTGIHRCRYDGAWPKGSWWILADGDIWPSRPILFRLLPEAQAEYDRKMAEAAARFAAERQQDQQAAQPDLSWPDSCPKRSSCARNLGCMYGCKTHAGRPGDALKREIQAALADANSKNPLSEGRERS